MNLGFSHVPMTDAYCIELYEPHEPHEPHETHEAHEAHEALQREISKGRSPIGGRCSGACCIGNI